MYSLLVRVGHPSAIRAREEHHVVFTLRPYTSRFSVSATKTQVYGIIRNIWLVNWLAGAGNRAVRSRYFFCVQLLDLILFRSNAYRCVCSNIFFFYSLFSSLVSSKMSHPPAQLLFLPSVSPNTGPRKVENRKYSSVLCGNVLLATIQDHWLQWLMFHALFLSSSQRNVVKRYKLGNEDVLPNPVDIFVPGSPPKFTSSVFPETFWTPLKSPTKYSRLLESTS